MFIEFVEELESTIRKAFPARIPKKNAREKVLAQFHSLSFSGVEKVWEKLYLRIGRELTVDRMMKQYTNDQIFAEMLLLTLLLPAVVHPHLPLKVLEVL